MCGIAATFGVTDPQKAVRRMLARLRHRGDCSDPSSSIAANAAVGTERLRIVDSRDGAQPTWSWNGEWLLAFNGEIYNHRQLRQQLESSGVTFRSQCDTEVLVNLIAKEGVACLDKLDGMFAFVAIHRDGKRFFAARDPMGVKPLYYAKEDHCYWFTSEILPLVEEVPAASVEFLPPGTWLSEKESGRFFRREQCLRSSGTLDEHANILADLLEEAIRKRLPPDLPCAVLFSGGIDSTLILHIARKFDKTVKGFYIGNDGGEDWDAAHLYVEATGADVEFVSFVESEVLALIPEVVRTVETFEPNQIRGGCFSYLLARHIHDRGYCVALCGEGADELFCGYPELQQVGGQNLEEQEHNLRNARNHFLDQLHRTQLLRVDRCSMRHQLEVRVPFLDRAIVQFAETLPTNHLVVPNSSRVADNKLVLRSLYRRYPEIPSALASRKKVVFTAGSGMGDNSAQGPFSENALRAMHLQGMPLEKPGTPKLRNLEDAYYWDLLSQVFLPARVPMLSERPKLNSR